MLYLRAVLAPALTSKNCGLPAVSLRFISGSSEQTWPCITRKLELPAKVYVYLISVKAVVLSLSGRQVGRVGGTAVNAGAVVASAVH